MSTDLHTASKMAQYAREFVFPLYRLVDGKEELFEVIRVSSVGPIPNGCWTAEMGPFYCMADSPDEWVAFAPDPNPLSRLSTDAEERLQWEAFLKEATFTSLDRALDAAVREQRRTQAQLYGLAKEEIR